jgi:N-acetylglucosaminyldiphosphoundecaprenol N-acetyl-beta-D-mannosaminyltransferase
MSDFAEGKVNERMAQAAEPEVEKPATLERLVGILGVPFHQLTLEEAVESVDGMVARRGTHYIVTPNVDFLVKAQRDTALHRILVNADLVLCDGMPILWASRWLGDPIPSRVTGSDLVPRLIERAAERGWRVFILGGGRGVAAEAARRIEAAHPSLPKVGHFCPPLCPLEEMDNAEIARRVRSAQPDLLIVCFGCPKQEKWMWQNVGGLGVPVSIGAGATVDFLANKVARAPTWMRRSGTEWLFRLAQEPGRLARRYADDLLHFFPAVARQRWFQRRRRASKPPGGSP